MLQKKKIIRNLKVPSNVKKKYYWYKMQFFNNPTIIMQPVGII